MNAEFNWWLLIVGLVVGGGLVWFVFMDSRRRDVDIDETERPREALWLSRMLADEGHDVSPEAAERMLLLHRTYLEAPPPDAPPAAPAAGPPATTADVSAPDASRRDTSDQGTPNQDDVGSELPADDRLGVQGRAPDAGQ